MAARQSYLHLSLKDPVQRLHKFAPVFLSISMVRNEPEPGEEIEESDAPKQPPLDGSMKGGDYPVCWFEDEESQIALRWHCYAGVLWDLKRKPKSLPWRLRLHFTQYPANQILPMETSVMTAVERNYRNSLKQALFLQQGNAKVAMSISKQSHGQIWDSIITTNYKLFEQVNDELRAVSNMLPVRLFVDSRPPIQRPLKVDVEYTLGDLLFDWVPALFRKVGENPEPTSNEVQWNIQGLQLPLGSKVKYLWQVLCHPDHFLYVVVTSK